MAKKLQGLLTQFWWRSLSLLQLFSKPSIRALQLTALQVVITPNRRIALFSLLIRHYHVGKSLVNFPQSTPKS